MVNLRDSKVIMRFVGAVVVLTGLGLQQAGAQVDVPEEPGIGIPIWSAHASPERVKVTRAGNKEYSLFFDGDALTHWYTDENDFSLVMKDGDYYYARLDPASGELVATQFRLGDVDPAKVGLTPRQYPTTRPHRHLAPPQPGEKPYRPRGKIKMMVVLMRFANHAERELPEPQVFNEILNRTGGHEKLAPGGSLRDFIAENSYGQLDLVSSVLPTWIPLPKSEKYYANGSSGIGGERRLEEAFQYCLDWIEQNIQVDFSDYDSNNDGFIDAIAFVHSGYSAASGDYDADGAEPKDRIWSHQWRMQPWKAKKGTASSYYLTLPAFDGSRGLEPVRLGLISHETAHLTRLMDLYDPSHRSSGVGAWSVLGFHWGFDGSGHFPSHLGAWEKTQLGWVKPVEITQPGEYRIRNAEDHPDVYKISQGFPNGEYLLIENRQPVGFHRHLPEGRNGRGGLAVWYIDENKEDNSDPGYVGQEGWPFNGSHFRVALLQADGRYDLEQRRDYPGDGDDLFRAGHFAEISPWFLSQRYPNTDPYLHRPSQGFRIASISASGKEMMFRIETVKQGDNAPAANAYRVPFVLGPRRTAPNVPPLRRDSDSAVRLSPPTAGSYSAMESTLTMRCNAGSMGTGNVVPTTAWKRLPANRRFEFAENTIILKARITLDEASDVYVSGQAMGLCRGRVLSGFSNSGDANVWPESSRWIGSTLEQRKSLRSMTVKRLEAGPHEIRWKILFPNGGRVVLDGGAHLSVQAFPLKSSR
ncbi:MAG: M6 family metalloprotease domain-containing protein [Planctomycetota bacterium]|nr:M6 family metalloprotease domain-containing protein [Planctomycetota bacterium]